MTNLKVRHLNGEVVELNLEKDKIYVDDQNKIVYFKFGLMMKMVLCNIKNLVLKMFVQHHSP